MENGEAIPTPPVKRRLVSKDRTILSNDEVYYLREMYNKGEKIKFLMEHFDISLTTLYSALFGRGRYAKI